ncbi:MAG TPA: 2'-deoxycytidine 5'-triphosphate deaminase [Chthonomonadales bacterium]|nr:2'-deoxycytidine 5'-triphosphate deaminase [Chthonomonadales bacterium]
MQATNGILPSQWIRQAIDQGVITSETPVRPEQIQPNSMDLRIGGMGHRIQCSFLPGTEGVQGKLNRYGWYQYTVPPDGFVLERNQVYLAPLQESLSLPAEVSARANPKSSTGRLDLFCRLVTQHGTTFDEAPAGYEGPLYLEVVPRSFAVRIYPGDCLAQVRFQVGEPALTHLETVELLDREDILLGSDNAVLRSSDVSVPSGIVLSVNLPRKNEPTVGYHARKNTRPIDFRGAGPIRQHWNNIYGGSRPIILEPDEFYIFASRELVRLPPDYCAEMVAFHAGIGELRTHYAGFFDSGFGYAPGRDARDTAAAVVLEVRSRDVPFLVEDGQPLFQIHLLRNTAIPDMLYGAELGSHYQSQRLRLSKHFSSPQDSAQDTPGGQESLAF